jgi:molybdenum ABC transporter molybdate-binding protein
MRPFAPLLGAMALAAGLAAGAAEPVKVYAAGSLRAALTGVAGAFTESTGAKVEIEFGPSGTLRDRLAQGARADVFASANMEHPQALAALGRARPARMFARNRLCAIAPRSYAVNTGNLLPSMLDPATRLATSTPKADPAGDYAWQVFERAEKLKAGSYEILSRKALQLVGGPSSPAPAADRTVYGMLMAEDKADIFLTYCTNAALAKRELPSLDIVALPEALAVFADYGLAVMQDATPESIAFAEFLLGTAGQGILARSGFAPPVP